MAHNHEQVLKISPGFSPSVCKIPLPSIFSNVKKMDKVDVYDADKTDLIIIRFFMNTNKPS
jgi:hypothetical protein